LKKARLVALLLLLLQLLERSSTSHVSRQNNSHTSLHSNRASIIIEKRIILSQPIPLQNPCCQTNVLVTTVGKQKGSLDDLQMRLPAIISIKMM